MFGIKASYATGDSFGHENLEEEIDYDWNDIEVVQENIDAILEHYQQYVTLEKGYGRGIENAEERWWYVKSSDPYETNKSLYLKKDNGDKFIYRCPWCGYFESLDHLQITIPLLKKKFTPFIN